MPESDLKRLALLMAVNCVRNTVIEDYHSHGKLSNAEMKTLNQEVANKIYTFLHYLFNHSSEDREAFLEAMAVMYPSNWHQPTLDADFVKAVSLANKRKKPIERISVRRLPPSASRSSKRAPKRGAE
jgi:hypothetical protein